MSVFSRAWEKDEILNPSRGIETETFGFRSIMLHHWATKNPQWAKPFRKLYGTYFQRNTRIGILMHNDDVTESGEFLSHA